MVRLHYQQPHSPPVHQGLVHLHSFAIVHGDLKPANVLLDNDGRPRIADWGLSRVSQGFTRTYTPATVSGFTQGYAAPEVVAGRRTSFASDMCVGWRSRSVAGSNRAHGCRYAFGCTVEDVIRCTSATSATEQVAVKDLQVHDFACAGACVSMPVSAHADGGIVCGCVSLPH